MVPHEHSFRLAETCAVPPRADDLHCACPWVSITGLVARGTGESASIPVLGHANGDSLDAGTKASQPLDSWHRSKSAYRRWRQTNCSHPSPPLLAAECTMVLSRPILSTLRYLAVCVRQRWSRERHSRAPVPRLTTSDEGRRSKTHHQSVLVKAGHGQTMPGTRLQSGRTVASASTTPDARGNTEGSSDPRRITMCKSALNHLCPPLVSSPRRSHTIAAWTTVSSSYAQVEISVQCSAAGAMWERIVEKDPRPSCLLTRCPPLQAGT
ncbi:hypothetical protein GMOD_00009402 [Pyrenophora seminiperda CCB06]|uniref:Uncharacterized protein n=1 Tax=Pyrenophora seminiperda CCB06 TaxID=1302712 RepID=A0A3M7MGQ6_9PLEO|nr:hypothetical protein GMOD_00009402 [Pyrenophora seminiperda CCB06]